VATPWPPITKTSSDSSRRGPRSWRARAAFDEVVEALERRRGRTCPSGRWKGAAGAALRGSAPGRNASVPAFLDKAGRVFKVLAPIYFAYDWSQGGFGHAVDEALWPVSELWSDDED
jgi:hypothetical protein